MATVWNIIDKNSAVALLGTRGVDHPSSGGWHNVRTVEARTTGRYYFEVKFVFNSSSSNAVIIAVCNAAQSLGDYPGANSNGLGFWDNGGQWLGGSGGGSSLGTIADGDTVGFDVDYDLKQIRACRNGGAWSSWASFSNVTGPYYLMASMNSGPAQILASWQKSHCKYAAPTGVSYYDLNYWTPAEMTGVTGLEWFDSQQGLGYDAFDSSKPVNSWASVRPGGGTATTANSFRNDFRPTITTVNGKPSVLFGTGSNQLNLDTGNLPVGTGDKFWFIASKSIETRSGDFYPWGYGSNQGTGVTWKMRIGDPPFSDVGNNGYNIGSVPISASGIASIVETYTETGTISKGWYNGAADPAVLVYTRNPRTDTRPSRLGHWPEYGNGSNQHLLRIGWGYGNPNGDDNLRLQGWLSWDTGDNGASLRSDHPYKNAAPLIADTTQPTVINASANITEDNDTTTSSGRVVIRASANITEDNDVMVSATRNRIIARATMLEQDDTLVSTSINRVKASVNFTEDNDMMYSSAAAKVQASAVLLEDNDTITASAKVKIVGNAYITEQDDLLSAGQIQVKIVGNSTSITEADDTVVSSASTRITLTANITEDNDTLVASYSSAAGFNANITEENDTLVATAKVLARATASMMEQDDTLTSSARNVIRASAILNEDDDTMASFIAGPGKIIAEAMMTEDDDTLAATVRTTLKAYLNAQEENDTLTSTTSNRITAISVLIEDNDTLTASGVVRATGYVAGTIDDDTLTASYKASIKASAALREDDDVLISQSYVITPVITPASRSVKLISSLSRNVTFTISTGYRTALPAEAARQVKPVASLSRSAKL